LTSQDQSLKPEDLAALGPACAELLLPGAEWIHRRREAVEILDETALRRQVSVDFTLPRYLNSGLRLPKRTGRGYPAPVFVLPKTSPANLMSFDLEDAGGKSLPLMTKAENGQLSAACLKAMASLVMPAVSALELELERELELIATEGSADAEGRAEMLLNRELSDPAETQRRLLLADERFRWWLFTLAHSSVVLVWCEACNRREIVKLTFRAPMSHQPSLGVSSGWRPYELLVDSSFVEARNHHFEAQAPNGLRIVEAQLGSENDAVRDTGFLRRIHLYLRNAERAGGTTAKVYLRVSAQGFIQSAWLPALLVSLALAGAYAKASEIAVNPNAAPALFLLLPGLIATYVGRPDLHALTSRLLGLARRLLLLSALAAYVVAGTVASLGATAAVGSPEAADRTHTLHVVAAVALLVSLVPLLVLVVARARADALASKAWAWARRRWRSWADATAIIRQRRFEFAWETKRPFQFARDWQDKYLQQASPDPAQLRIRQRAFAFRIVQAGASWRTRDGSRLTFTGDATGPPLLGLVAGFRLWWTAWKLWRRLEKELSAVELGPTRRWWARLRDWFGLPG
jgi:hypothetical protein